MLIFAYVVNIHAQSKPFKKFISPGNIYSTTKSNHVSVTFPSDSAGNEAGSKDVINLNDYDYATLTAKADSFFYKKSFIEASKMYVIAFKNNNDQGKVRHRYNLACCYAALNAVDKSFEQLYRIAQKGNYYNYIEIRADQYFIPLQKDERWQPLMKIIEDNSRKNEDKLQSQLPKNDK